jgi:hypothetical protein
LRALRQRASKLAAEENAPASDRRQSASELAADENARARPRAADDNAICRSLLAGDGYELNRPQAGSTHPADESQRDREWE